MAETLTPHFSWIKPDIGGDASTWGNVLNTTFDAIDAVVWTNQQAGVPIGSLTMFAGSVLPANWLWCDGTIYLDTDIPALAPILNRKYAGSDPTHNAVPNLNARFALGADFSTWPLGLQGGEQDHVLTVTEMPAHNHTGSQVSHTHPGSWQDGHVHAASQDVHVHGIGQNPHAHNIATGNHSHPIHTGGHNHNYNTWGTGGGIAVRADAPSYFQQLSNATTTTSGDLGGNTDTAGNLGGGTDAQYAIITTGGVANATDGRQPGVYTDNRQPAVYIDTQQPAVTIGNRGGGVKANNMPPYTAVGFIIRYK